MTTAHTVLRILLILCTAAAAACATRPDPDVIARELYGSWVTAAPQYAERGFDISRDSVTLHQGGGIQVRYAIERISRSERDAFVDYVITYRGVVSSLDFTLEYRAGDGEPDVRFPNQQRVIWKRASVTGS